ncbi:unnamed protein product [Symbiodinium microadriaticum]|nr:unnamed protein product [Symbiodinium microadriaticum]
MESFETRDHRASESPTASDRAFNVKGMHMRRGGVGSGLSRTAALRPVEPLGMSEKEKGKGDKKKDDKKKDDKKAAAKGPAISLDPPSGTRDFFPADMRFRNWLFGAFKEIARRYSFQEYDAPVLENEELYKRKAGEEITEQMYNFIDKDGAAVTLRPEMTPSLARMVLSLMRAETGEMSALLPLKWSSIPQCWRFETCQRGRKREHYQWNMDIVGITSIHAEVELLSAITSFFEHVGITSKEVGIKVNSRKVLGAVLKNSGVPDERFTETCVVIDKQDKIGAEAVVKELTEKIGLDQAVAQRIVNATAAKTLDEFASLAGVGESPEVVELRQLFTLAEEEGFGDWLIFDASVVRGLAYYTGVVFEGFDRAGVLRAICGGGRYDRLLTLYGSPKEVPCAGFGFGDCVIYELLKEKKVLPELPHKVDFVVAAFNQDMMGKVLEEYSQALKCTTFTDCEQVCFVHAPRLAQAAQRLPHNAPSRLLPGDAVETAGAAKPAATKDLPDILPKTAPSMVRSLLKGLEPAWRCEAELAPEPLAASAQRGAVLVAAEAWATELGELLQSAPDWTVRQHGEWAVGSSLERLTAFLRWLTGIVSRTCTELIDATPSTTALEEHSVALRSVARLVSRMSGYMQGALGSMDPVRPISARLGAAAEGLQQAAEELREKASHLLHDMDPPKDDASASRQHRFQQEAPPRSNLMRQSRPRSILGILAGHPDWQLPDEAQRVQTLRQHLEERRDGGTGQEERKVLIDRQMEGRRPRTTVLAFGAARERAENRAAQDFALLDTDNDGVVSAEEFRAARVPELRRLTTM